MLNTFISAILQVLLFSSIPFVVFLIKRRSVKGFLNYLGLKKSNLKANLLALLVMLLLVVPLMLLILLSEEFKAIMMDPESVTGQIKEMGFGTEAIITILIAAVIKTSLSEEIFFRGFVAKRLIAVVGFRIGNIVQAIIFGMIHTLLFLTITDNVFFLVIIFIFPTIGAYFKTYINEEYANGSIVPGWIAHGSANIISYSVVPFVI